MNIAMKGTTAFGALAGLLLSTSAWSVDQTARIYPIVESGGPSVSFTDIAVEYKPGRSKKRSGAQDTVFFAESTSTSAFAINNPNGTSDYFAGGALEVDAFISPKGTLKDGTFGIYADASLQSNIDMFGGAATAGYDCNKKGNGCQKTGYVVYTGDLNAFGWDGNAHVLDSTGGYNWGTDLYGLLEFGITNQSGWAWDKYGVGSDERLILAILGGFDLNGASSVTSFTATAQQGIAIIPVPAAVWLFGSGLLGLVGVARRKQKAA